MSSRVSFITGLLLVSLSCIVKSLPYNTLDAPMSRQIMPDTDCKDMHMEGKYYCMFHPPNCMLPTSNMPMNGSMPCVLAVKVMLMDDKKTLKIVQTAKVRPGPPDEADEKHQYIAVGFSQTRNKDYTSVTDCTMRMEKYRRSDMMNETYDHHISYNDPHSGNNRINKMELRDMTMKKVMYSKEDDYIICSYERPLMVEDVGLHEKVFNLMGKIYYLFAVTSYATDKDLGRHGGPETGGGKPNPYFPAVSTQLVDFSKMKTYDMAMLQPLPTTTPSAANQFNLNLGLLSLSVALVLRLLQ